MRESPNTLYVVAAGNGGEDEVGDSNDTTAQYPCNYTISNLICVAASDRNDRLTSFSNYSTTHVDIAAPGQHILSTWKGNDQYAYLSGTSQATPLVTGRRRWPCPHRRRSRRRTSSSTSSTTRTPRPSWLERSPETGA